MRATVRRRTAVFQSRSKVRPGELEKLPGLVAGRVSTNALKAYGPVGDLFLRRGRR